MNFTAESEKDLQEWLVPLKAVAGVESFRSSTPITYIHTELRMLWLNSVTYENETILHILARVGAQCVDKEHTVKLAAWCISYGVDVNASNISGQTALHLTLLYNSCREFVNLLLLRGGDVNTIRDVDGRSVNECLLQLSRGSVRASISPTTKPSTVAS